MTNRKLLHFTSPARHCKLECLTSLVRSLSPNSRCNSFTLLATKLSRCVYVTNVRLSSLFASISRAPAATLRLPAPFSALLLPLWQMVVSKRAPHILQLALFGTLDEIHRSQLVAYCTDYSPVLYKLGLHVCLSLG